MSRKRGLKTKRIHIRSGTLRDRDILNLYYVATGKTGTHSSTMRDMYWIYDGNCGGHYRSYVELQQEIKAGLENENDGN